MACVGSGLGAPRVPPPGPAFPYPLGPRSYAWSVMNRGMSLEAKEFSPSAGRGNLACRLGLGGPGGAPSTLGARGRVAGQFCCVLSQLSQWGLVLRAVGIPPQRWLVRTAWTYSAIRPRHQGSPFPCAWFGCQYRSPLQTRSPGPAPGLCRCWVRLGRGC